MSHIFWTPFQRRRTAHLGQKSRSARAQMLPTQSPVANHFTCSEKVCEAGLKVSEAEKWWQWAVAASPICWKNKHARRQPVCPASRIFLGLSACFQFTMKNGNISGDSSSQGQATKNEN
ncbi:hypothetical protein P4O66_002389 [Electrophorus voltai]|uniref:Uncharacterized protein n=1 Tax=Electrophorus voltai TaxID=2609070 RepID=A0AAD9DR36_9TELE|nr:hypothetical protein P4O66_002389 [Electrophorus voltai]